MSVRKYYRELERMAARMGVEKPTVTDTGKHPKLMGRIRGGRSVAVVVSRTPSCPRAVANHRAYLRRLMKEDEIDV